MQPSESETSSTMANTINLQTFADDVAGITGPEHVRTEGGVLITTPANTEQIAAILRYANKNSMTIAPYGGGTKQSWGNPVRPALMLHTNHLNSVREHTWQDMTCTVAAG